MFGSIVNPETGRRVNVNGPTGQRVLAKYAKQSGGARGRKPGTAPTGANVRKMFSAAAGRGRPAGRTVAPTKKLNVKKTGCRYVSGRARPCRVASPGRTHPKCV